jgi:hypothetical protein
MYQEKKIADLEKRLDSLEQVEKRNLQKYKKTQEEKEEKEERESKQREEKKEKIEKFKEGEKFLLPNEKKEYLFITKKLDALEREEKKEVKKGLLAPEDKTLFLINQTKKLLYENEVSKLAREAASYFIIGIMISFILFIVLWYMSIDNGNLNGYFNSIFCNKKD